MRKVKKEPRKNHDFVDYMDYEEGKDGSIIFSEQGLNQKGNHF